MPRLRIILTLFLAVPSGVQAQFKPSELRPALDASRVRLQLAGQQRLVGRALALDPPVLQFRMRVYRTVHDAVDVDTTIALDSIARAWVFRGTQWRRGAAIGAGAGIALFVAFAATLGEALSEQECPEICLAGAGAGGAVFGGLLGGIVGAFIVRWHELPREGLLPNTRLQLSGAIVR